MRPIPRGIYTAVPTFFYDDEELDLDAFIKHVQYVAEAGTVPVPTGTMGEACHLDPRERRLLITATREVLDSSPATWHMPVIAGVGAPSTRETISLAYDAKKAGADYAMVIPPGYYAGALKADNMRALKQYFVDVSARSPIPVIMYNFPAVSSGIDMDADTVIDIIKRSPNICGMKFTCANVAKIGRITATLEDETFQSSHPRSFHTDGESKKNIPYFSAIDGFIDILLPSMSVRATGAITALSNFLPHCCVKLWKLCEEYRVSPSLEKQGEVQRWQDYISLADGEVQKLGVSGMKMVLSHKFGYNALPRKPLLPMTLVQIKPVLERPDLSRLLDAEVNITEGLRSSAQRA